MKIKRIEPMSLARILGVLYAVLGLIAGLFILFISSMLPRGINLGMTGFMFGIGAPIFLPILYGVIGFFSGLIGAVLYNFVAKWVGGIELETE